MDMPVNWESVKHNTRRRLWMLRTGARELATQLQVELEAQREFAVDELGSAREEIRDWLDDDRALDQRVRDVRRFGREFGATTRRQASRLAERSVDLTLATAAFTRLQSLHYQINGPQTWAPFFLSFHEAKAGVVLALMPAHKRAELVPMAERIREAQLRMGERTRRYNDCALCERPLGGDTGGGCCSSAVGQMFRPIDGLFRRLLGERAPFWPRLPDDFTRCGYMGPSGCMLPAGVRPIICVGFYCNAWRGTLEADGVWRALAPDFQQIRGAIRELEFRFNMHRRFLAKQGNTIHDGTMGYLWTKLMSLYASYDQVVPATQTAGVNALDDEPRAAEAPSGVSTESAPGAKPAKDGAADDGMSYDQGVAEVAALLLQRAEADASAGDDGEG